MFQPIDIDAPIFFFLTEKKCFDLGILTWENAFWILEESLWAFLVSAEEAEVLKLFWSPEFLRVVQCFGFLFIFFFIFKFVEKFQSKESHCAALPVMLAAVQLLPVS